LLSTGTQLQSGAAKSLQDIYTGIDVWGRGTHGGGGLGSYRALEHIDPVSLGLSVALFGPGWTWEKMQEQDKQDFSWTKWWEIDRRLWIGPSVADEDVIVPPMTKREEEPDCPHGPFRPISDFFATHPPPDPALIPFCTSFSPGIGFAWFVNGMAVMPRTESGWADIDKQSALGDKLWPRPEVQWEEREGTTEPVPDASSTLYFDDAWLGGNSLRVAFNAQGSEAEDAIFRSIWLPIQSLNITPLVCYTACLIFKPLTDTGPPVDIVVGLTIKCPGSALDVSDITATEDLSRGWTRQTLTFTLPENQSNALVIAGLVLGFATEDPSKEVQFSILLGQLAVYQAPPTPRPYLSLASPRVLWADFKPSEDRKSGLLTWETAAGFSPISLPASAPTVESPTPLWSVDTSDHVFPSCAYFNIYAGTALAGPTQATFIGTTGLDGRPNRFHVDWGVLPNTIKGLKEIRFYVQGVTNHGEAMEWERCVFVDASR
jgi:mannosyl-glycoprotein endo-beta-N-acetylglucosaminidase